MHPDSVERNAEGSCLDRAGRDKMAHLLELNARFK
jgi:hypothetical protein